ncbi:hypothetical protein SAY86_011779 [Trapa natans]|uniref:Uncharacterized protein n=1 Tax=Trapa natans TaxID=22666 RepID=A0AAN7LW69_TRANT|nr:hypothetical protein SAY86_011779 [Trapa natans]
MKKQATLSSFLPLIPLEQYDRNLLWSFVSSPALPLCPSNGLCQHGRRERDALKPSSGFQEHNHGLMNDNGGRRWDRSQVTAKKKGERGLSLRGHKRERETKGVEDS